MLIRANFALAFIYDSYKKVDTFSPPQTTQDKVRVLKTQEIWLIHYVSELFINKSVCLFRRETWNSIHHTFAMPWQVCSRYT